MTRYSSNSVSSRFRGDEPWNRFWSPPAALYTPIRQDAIVLARAKDDAAARAFPAFLKTPRGREMIESFGYGVE
jgi:ABC-type molybdate transport system substrate-binding protein